MTSLESAPPKKKNRGRKKNYDENAAISRRKKIILIKATFSFFLCHKSKIFAIFIKNTNEDIFLNIFFFFTEPKFC